MPRIVPRVPALIPTILLLALPAQAEPEPPPHVLGWPLLLETPSADGEDAPGDGTRPRYFSFGLNSFAYWPSHQDKTLADRVESIPHRTFMRGREKETLSPPQGVQWDLAKVWCSADKEWIFWRGTNQGKPIIHAASTRAFSNSIELRSQHPDTPLDAEFLEPSAMIINNRIYFLGDMEIPEPLRTTFDPALGLIAEQPHWREIAWPQHINLVEEMRERILNNIDQPPPNDDSRKTIAIVRELLDKKPMRISGDDIEGDWRIRSLQGSALGHFTYPFFKARIENLDGIFFFEKTTGSQRRSGALHRHLSDTMIFLGGRTVNDDPQVGYSGAYPDNTLVDSDSIGLLHQLAPDHLIMLLDVDYNGNYEIYDMRK
jgi:hypothetical protein